MDLDVVTLARAQFALTIMVHYLFPPLSIGLGALMVIHEGMYLRTGDKEWESLARFWTRIYAVNFAVGVATGIVMEFEFGTNWARYSRFVGDVFGSALASEGIFAFFLESGFLAVLVFGWDKVSPRVHFLSTVLVFFGSCFSAVWIVIANSWMHTPAGFHLVGEGDLMRAEITDFWAMVFNPSSMHRLGHVLLGCFLLGAFFMTSISAYYLLRGRHVSMAKKSFRVALLFGAVSTVLMFASGHSQAVMVSELQPAKLAAFEGHFHTGEGGSPLYLMGLPDEEAEEVRFGIAIPKMLSFLVHADFDVPVTGLDQIADENQPPVVVPFLAYHVMIGLGSALAALTALGLFFLWRGTLWEQKWLLRLYVVAVFGPYIANQAGWVASEVGRQPWVVYGLLRTVDGVSRAVPAEQVLTSIVLFGVIYLALFVLWLVVMNEKIQHGPDDPSSIPSPVPDAQGDLVLAAVHRGVPGTSGLADTDDRRESREMG